MTSSSITTRLRPRAGSSFAKIGTILIVDASIAVKWLVRESDSASAIALLTRERLGAPTLIVAEVANACAKKRNRGELTGWPDLSGLSAGLSWMERDLDFAPNALLLSARLRHSVYDCFYLALAVKRGEQLITADLKFVEKCRAAGYADLVLTLAEWRA